MELREYQKRIANWLATRRHACMSVGMGLGKTAAVLHYLDWRLKGWPHLRILIVAPKRVAEEVWCQEADKWQLWQLRANMSLIAGTAKRKQERAADKAPVHVVGRDNLQWLLNNYPDYRYIDILVMDELTSFKSWRATRSKAARSITAQQKIGMTGTFAPNGLIDVYPQLAACGVTSADDGDYYAWRGRWFVDVNKGRKGMFPNWQLRKGVDPAEVLRDFEEDIITITTEEYLQVPAMTEEVVSLELSKNERAAYDGMSTALHFSLPDDWDGDFAVGEGARFAKLHQLVCGFVYDEDGHSLRVSDKDSGTARSVKIEWAVELCRQAAEEGEQVLLYYIHREAAAWFGERAQAAGLVIRSVKAGGDWLTQWNEHRLDVLVANPASCGHGLNLQYGGRIIVWLELTYNYELWAQANARLHRTGQQYPVIVYYTIAADTVDTAMMAALKRKEKENKKIERMTRKNYQEK